jgi:hypothetical protein
MLCTSRGRFLHLCDVHGLEPLIDFYTVHISIYIEQMTQENVLQSALLR